MPRRVLAMLLGIETLAVSALLVWLLSRADRLTDPSAWLVGLLIVVAGDVATAFIMQRFAPTRITVQAGEPREQHGVAAADFDAGGHGFVLLRGERWQAEAAHGAAIGKGSRVRIVDRAGLTLVVEPAGADTRAESGAR